MLLSHNIEVTDSAANTCNPFEYGCSMCVGDVKLPWYSFLSIRIITDVGNTLPVKLSKVVPAEDKLSVELIFSDTTAREVARCKIPKPETLNDRYVNRTMTGSNGYGIRGHISYRNDAIYSLFSLKREISIGVNDFILLPSCISPMLVPRPEVYVINGEVCAGIVDVKAGPLVRTEIGEDSIAYSIATGYTEPPKDAFGINRLAVDARTHVRTALNRMVGAFSPGDLADKGSITIVDSPNVNLKGAQLNIRSSITSNLRVITGSAGIEVKGVQDV